MQELNLQEFLPQVVEFSKNHSLMVVTWIVLFVMTIYFFYKDFTRQYKIVENDEAIRLMNNENAVVLDLRPMDEFQRGHIVSSVNFVPQDVKDGNLAQLEKHKSVPVIVVDSMGVNGMNAGKSAEMLCQNGFAHVYLLKEGLTGWNSANLPLVSKHKK